MKSAEKVEPDEQVRRVKAALAEVGLDAEVCWDIDRLSITVPPEAFENGGQDDVRAKAWTAMFITGADLIACWPCWRQTLAFIDLNPCPHPRSSWAATAPSLRRPAHREDAP